MENLQDIGIGLAVGLSAIGTGYAQAKIGSAAVAAIQEDRKLTGIMIVLVALPETMVILGFVVAVLMIYR